MRMSIQRDFQPKITRLNTFKPPHFGVRWILPGKDSFDQLRVQFCNVLRTRKITPNASIDQNGFCRFL